MSQPKQIVIIDNHDSFTYNLFQLFDENPHCQITVLKNDEVTLEQLAAFDKIVLSPGPDVPGSYPILFEIITRFKGVKPILGVCLGHQTIGEYFGATLVNLPLVYHGKQSNLTLLADEVLFQKLTSPIVVGLYHSWALDIATIAEPLVVTALSAEGVVMGIAHCNYNIKGIQFHPESFMTEQGRQMINNWIEEVDLPNTEKV